MKEDAESKLILMLRTELDSSPKAKLKHIKLTN